MLESLMGKLPDVTDDDLLLQLLQDAADFICAYTGRTSVPDILHGTQVQLAVIYYNRRGMEGETKRDEGDVSRTVSILPDDILSVLNPYRLARTVG